MTGMAFVQPQGGNFPDREYTLVKPTEFGVTEAEDPNEWIERFNRIAETNKWNEPIFHQFEPAGIIAPVFLCYVVTFLALCTGQSDVGPNSFLRHYLTSIKGWAIIIL
jgi:hypothetical protein